MYYASHFSGNRKIDPTILAIHAEDIHKKEILDCAIEAAKNGRISWSIPINLTESFYVVRKPEGAVNPLFMLYFNEDHSIDYYNSLLQIHSIQELYGKDMPSKITLWPSLLNNQDKSIVENQLNQIKNILVNDFLLMESQVHIELIPSEDKVYDDFTDFYLYTISAERLSSQST